VTDSTGSFPILTHIVFSLPGTTNAPATGFARFRSAVQLDSDNCDTVCCPGRERESRGREWG
jgi:hypothetical protein